MKKQKTVREFEDDVAELINEIVDKHKFVLLEFRDGFIFWLREHHRYLQPEREAPRVKLAKHYKIDRLHYKKEDFLYLTDKV